MAMTYNSLTQDVSNYLERTDASTTSNIPLFISNAQQRLSRDSKNVGLESYLNGTFTVGQAIYPKPANWRRNVTFSFGSGPTFNYRKPIELRVYEYVNAYWPDRSQTGEPQFYCDYGYNSILVAPTPDKKYPYELGILQMDTPITSANQSNWWTDFAPEVLLNCVLLEANYFLKNYESIPSWEKKYADSLSALNTQDDMRINDRQTDRSTD